MVIKKGDTVVHTHSKLEGEVMRTRKHPSGYNYRVRWLGYIESDWFKIEVLKKI